MIVPGPFRGGREIFKHIKCGIKMLNFRYFKFSFGVEYFMIAFDAGKRKYLFVKWLVIIYQPTGEPIVFEINV